MSRLRAKSTNKKYSRLAFGKARDFTIYQHVVYFFLENYETDQIIADKESKLYALRAAVKQDAVRVCCKVGVDILSCGDVYEKCALNKVFIEGLEA